MGPMPASSSSAGIVHLDSAFTGARTPTRDSKRKKSEKRMKLISTTGRKIKKTKNDQDATRLSSLLISRSNYFLNYFLSSNHGEQERGGRAAAEPPRENRRPKEGQAERGAKTPKRTQRTKGRQGREPGRKGGKGPKRTKRNKEGKTASVEGPKGRKEYVYIYIYTC